MATRAPISKTGPTVPRPKLKKKENTSLRSLRGRTPHIRLASDVVSSPWEGKTVPTESGTVIPAGKFKATCLQLLDAAAAGESITITKRGRPVARLVPPEPPEAIAFVPLLGLMKGKVKILGDIVSPDFEAWGMEAAPKTKKKRK